ncbi:MAG: hypothetical protein EON96_01530 [Caulobacteraceae bacterium]|nr:MAG: hypothetical protein EON96_01530 [Caulobacteraceae bacterium]
MSDQDYAVGYGRPPEQHRFKPGRSGNPKGRPKGSHNFQTLLADELHTRVAVTINGKTVRLTKAELTIRQQVDKAAKGDPRAFGLLIKLMGLGGPQSAAGIGQAGVAADQTELTPEQLSQILLSVARDRLPQDAS